jgi:hypothetical protein
MTTRELSGLIDLVVNPKGGNPKITGPALNILLKSLANEFNGTLPLVVEQDLTSSSTAVPSVAAVKNAIASGDSESFTDSYSKVQSDQRYSPLGFGAVFANSHYNRVKLTRALPINNDYSTIGYDAVVAGSAIINGIFTAPETGLWCLSTTTLLQGNQGQWYVNGYYRRDGIEVDKFVEGVLSFAVSAANTYVSNVYLYLRAGQQVAPVLKAGQDNATSGLNVLGFPGDGEYTSFTAFLLFPATVTGSSNVSLDFAFQAGFANNFVITISASRAATYVTQMLSNVDSLTYTVNGVAATLPFTVAINDTLLLTITRQDESKGAVVTLLS